MSDEPGRGSVSLLRLGPPSTSYVILGLAPPLQSAEAPVYSPNRREVRVLESWRVLQRGFLRNRTNPTCRFESTKHGELHFRAWLADGASQGELVLI